MSQIVTFQRIATTNGGMDRNGRLLELSLINDSLQKDLLAKDREIRRLNKDLQQYEQTMAGMRDEMDPAVLKKDAEVMAGMCCTGTECGDLVPVKDVGELLQEETSKYRERIQNMEVSLKSSSVKLRTVHKVNLGLIEELKTLRCICAAFDMERRDLKLKLELESQIVKQMVRQLRQAKAKDNVCVVTSTPDGTQVLPDEAEISIIPLPQTQSAMTISDEDLIDDNIILELCHCGANDVHEQTTLKLDTPEYTQSLNLKTNYSLRDIDGNLRLNTSNLLDQNINTGCKLGNLCGSLDITPQIAQNHDNNLETECNPRKREKSTSSQGSLCTPKYVTPVARTRESSENLQLESIQSTNLVYEHSDGNKASVSQSRSEERATEQSVSPQTDSSGIGNRSTGPLSKHQHEEEEFEFNQSQSRYNISETRSGERSSGMQPDSGQTANSQSKNIYGHGSEDQIDGEKVAPNQMYPNSCLIHKSSPRDLVVKIEKDWSHDSRNKNLISLPEATRAGNKRDSPSEDNQRLLNPNKELSQTQPRAKDQMKNDEDITEQCLCKCLCIPSTSEMSSKECLCKCHCQGTPYGSKAAPDSLSNETSSKQETDKETIQKSANHKETNCKCCQCKCTCKETKESDKPIVSDTKGWLISPEGIMKSLEALKQSFLGKTEDNTSIWMNKTTQSSLNENIQTDSSVTPNASSENRRKKSVSIQEPSRSKCTYCDPTVSCEEENGGCVSPKMDREVQKPERSDKSQGEESSFFVENARMNIHWEPIQDEEDVLMATETPIGARRMFRAKIVKKESTPPAQDSGGSSCAGACEQYYHDKLLATLQILENKEETIRVQGSSLAVAEDRITELTKRATELRRDLERKAQELDQIRQFAESRADKSDVNTATELKEAEAQKQLVDTLEDNLSSVIELYRECFYETAKQEELIDMLRKSYLDVRLMEKEKTHKITRLQNVINTQKRSIEQCQDVVLEVESLKSEISSFLNSSNNDSGMWERGSESPDVGEELADILDQLRQLQQMLTSDCTCGLEEENSSLNSLKERNRTLEVELEKQRQRNNELDGALRQILDQQYEKQIKEKELELQEVLKKVADLESSCKERGEACETLTRQLQQTQVMLNDKTAELAEMQHLRETQEGTIRRLQQDLDRSEQLVAEGLKKLSEVAHSRTELLLESQARVSELEQRLRHAARRCCELEGQCREREACLEEAHARGAALCEESRRVTAAVKRWMREKRQLAREQQEKIKMQRLRIRELERCVGARQNHSEITSQSDTDPCCSNTQDYRLSCETTYPRCFRLNPTCRSETVTFPRGPMAGRERESETASSKGANRQEGASEMASCSRAPVPPRRRKRQSYDDITYRHTSQPSRNESPAHPDIRWSRLYSRLRQASPTDELLERVKNFHAALTAGQRRWGRHRR